MKVTVVGLFVCVAGCLIAGAAAKSKVWPFPKFFKKCKRNDLPCLKTAVQAALPLMAGGLPKLGILPIDPLRVTEMLIDEGQGPVSLKLTLSEQDLHGISSAIVNSVECNMTDDSYMLGVDVTIPVFALTGHYIVAGRILVLPLQGEGKDNLTLTDLTAKLRCSGRVVEREGNDYVEIDDYSFHFDTTRLHIDLENLFNGEKAVSDNMLEVLNADWRDVLNEVQPGIEEALTVVFKSITANIYSKVPYSVMHDLE